MDERMWVEDMIEKMIHQSKKVNSKKLLTQNIQKIWDTVKRLNPRIIGIEEQEIQLKCPESIFSKIIG